MGEPKQREGWANVYANGATGACWDKREDAVWFCRLGGSPITHRWHVRLKPEGAPRRYADAVDRWIWENGSPATHGWSPLPPRTPKTEESAS